MNGDGSDVDVAIANDDQIVRAQVALAPLRQAMMRKITAKQREIDEAEEIGDHVALGPLWQELETLRAESALIELSEEDYKTLKDRHTNLLQRMDARCKELVTAKDYKNLSPLSARMGTLKQLNLQSLVQPAAVATWSIEAAIAAAAQFPELADLVEGRRLIVEQVNHTSQRRVLSQSIRIKKAALKAQLVPVEIDRDQVKIGSLRQELKALTEQSDALPLSEEDYLTLQDRHDMLVQQMSDKCVALSLEGNYAALKGSAALLESLRAINVAAYCPTDAGDDASHPNAAPPPAPNATAVAQPAAPRADSSDRALRAAERAADDVQGPVPPLPQPDAQEPRTDGAVRSEAVIEGLSVSYDAARTYPIVVRNADGSKCTIERVTTVLLDGMVNRGKDASSVTITKTVGFEKNRSVTLTGALTAGISFLSAQTGVSATWSSNVSETTAVAHTVTYPANTDTKVLQEVLEGYMTYPKLSMENLGRKDKVKHYFSIRTPNLQVVPVPL